MEQYHEILRRVLQDGQREPNRTGVDSLRLCGHQARFDLREGFPLVTTKKLHVKSIVHELLWMLSGASNIAYLRQNGVNIWNDWADDEGELGPVYGVQWRKHPTYAPWPNYTSAAAQDPETGGQIYVEGPVIDQIGQLIEGLISDPQSRRLIVTAWNPAQIAEMKLPPCHMTFQALVIGGRLNLHLLQRSCDVFLGLPFNIASYALLTHMLAQVAGLEVGEFVWTGVDVHLYVNHLDQAKLQLTRTPRHLPRLELNPEISKIDDFRFEDIQILGYDPHPHIKGDVAV